MSRRDLLDCGVDPVADGWAVALWSATAELHFCLYLHRPEGEIDSAGRWRRRHFRHLLIGRAPDQARAAAMAQHFCMAVRLAARAYATSGGRCAHARRSFQIACAKRLVARLRAALAAAAGEAGDEYRHEAEANSSALAEAGLERIANPDTDGIASWDRAAVRHGKAAADNLSLVLRERSASPAITRASRAQPQLPF